MTSPADGIANPSSSMREPFLSESVCTVMLSAPIETTRSIVLRKPDTLSVGRPAMTSMLMCSMPPRLTISIARSTSPDVCRRPMASSTASSIVCGLTLTRVTPCVLSTAIFSSSTVSGRPASTVYSSRCERSKLFSSSKSSASSCFAVSVVGVPPPMYTVLMLRPSERTSSAPERISANSAPRYGSISENDFSTDELTKLQYAQRVGQKGIPT
ncbi:hypothetical protein SDC9_160653 [bioreactor metagenome]|uniref:Uncharacterized protein n=1 Tax=bioreactor metagenome TaxID=1076179 RepID=A0A645FIH7_9ZZZZ